MTAAAIAHGTVPFPVGEVHSSDFTALEAILGEEFQGTKGKVYRLVKADATVASPAKRCFKRASAGSDTVTLTTGAGVSVCGVAVADQVALTAGDYFFLQVAGEVSLIEKSGETVAATNHLLPEANGEVKPSSTPAAVSPLFPAVCHTESSGAVSAYIVYKLWGIS